MRYSLVMVFCYTCIILASILGVFVGYRYVMPVILNAFPTLQIDRTPRKYFDPLRFDNHASR